MHPVFHVSMLKKCIRDPLSILPIEGLEVDVDLYNEKVLVDIDRQVNRLSYKEVASVKVLSKNHIV